MTLIMTSMICDTYEISSYDTLYRIARIQLSIILIIRISSLVFDKEEPLLSGSVVS